MISSGCIRLGFRVKVFNRKPASQTGGRCIMGKDPAFSELDPY